MEIVASPVMLLMLLFSVQLLIYYDRGLMASLISVLQTTLHPQPINDTSMGVLGSGFVAGYMVSCPVFAYLAKTRSIYKLMVFGLSLWCISIGVCACSSEYSGMLIGRLISGVGEASFAGLAPTVIDDIAPKKYRTSWLSLFYAALPVGGAIGYVCGGIFASSNWRAGFFTEALLMVPLIIMLFYVKPTKSSANVSGISHDDAQIFKRAASMPPHARIGDTANQGTSSTTSTLYHPIQMHHDVPDSATSNNNYRSTNQRTLHGAADNQLLPLDTTINHDQQSVTASGRTKSVKWALPSSADSQQLSQFKQPSLVRVSSAPISTVDYSDNEFLTDVLILISEPVYLCIVLGMSALTFVIGAMSFWAPIEYSKLLHLSLKQTSTIMGGITLSTGIFGTWIGGVVLDYRGGGAGIEGVQRAMQLSTCCTAAAIAFAIISVSSDSATLAFSALTIADICMFASSAPVNAALLSVVPQPLRALGMAMSILLMHALGDLPSPLLVGYLSDEISDVRLTMLVMCGWMSFSVLFWGVACALMAKRARDLRKHSKSLLTGQNDGLEATNVIRQYQSITT